MGKVVNGGLNMHKGFYEEFSCEKLYKYHKALSWIFSRQSTAACAYYFMTIFVASVLFIHTEVCRTRKSCSIAEKFVRESHNFGSWGH